MSGLHPDHPGSNERQRPSVDEYLDARGRGHPAKSMLDGVLRDSSVLDDLARDREWIDEMRSPTSAPDQTHRILGRLGVDAGRFDSRRHRSSVLTRRLSTAAVLALAFVVGMWARSSVEIRPMDRPVEAAHRLERVIESLPIQTDPFDHVRGLMLQAGSTLADPASGEDPAVEIQPSGPRAAPGPTAHPPVRAGVGRGKAPPIDPAGFIDEDMDVDSLKLLYQDLGIV